MHQKFKPTKNGRLSQLSRANRGGPGRSTTREGVNPDIDCNESQSYVNGQKYNPAVDPVGNLVQQATHLASIDPIPARQQKHRRVAQAMVDLMTNRRRFGARAYDANHKPPEATS